MLGQINRSVAGKTENYYRTCFSLECFLLLKLNPCSPETENVLPPSMFHPALMKRKLGFRQIQNSQPRSLLLFMVSLVMLLVSNLRLFYKIQLPISIHLLFLLHGEKA